MRIAGEKDFARHCGRGVAAGQRDSPAGKTVRLEADVVAGLAQPVCAVGPFGGGAEHRLRPHVRVQRQKDGVLGDVRVRGDLVRKQAGQARRLRFQPHDGETFVQRRQAERVCGGVIGGRVAGRHKAHVPPELQRLCVRRERLALFARADEHQGQRLPRTRARKGVQQEQKIFLRCKPPHEQEHPPRKPEGRFGVLTAGCKVPQVDGVGQDRRFFGALAVQILRRKRPAGHEVRRVFGGKGPQDRLDEVVIGLPVKGAVRVADPHGHMRLFRRAQREKR